MRRSTTTAAGLSARLPFALALALALAAACGDDGEGGALPDGGVSPDGGEPPGETSRIRFIHASPDAPALDVYPAGGDAPLLEDLAYTEASRYLELESGSSAFAIRPAGAGAASEPIFTTEPIDLPQGERTSAIAAGSPEETEELAFRVLPLREGFIDPGFERAVVRVVHAAPDVETAAFDIGDDGDVDQELQRFQATSAGGIPIPAGEPLQLEVFGGEFRAHLTTFTVPPLAEGEARFLIVTGRTDRPPSQERALSLLSVGPEGADARILQNPALQVLHAVPDAPAVDVRAGGQLLVWNLGFAELSAARQVPPGAIELSLSENEGGASLGAATTSELEAGGRYLVVATGFATPRGEEPGLRVLTARDPFTGGEAEPQLAAVHAIPDAGALDLGVVEGGLLATPPLAEGLSFGEASGALAVPIGALDLGAAPTGTRGPQVRFGLTTVEGQRTFVVFAGALAPSWDEQFARAVQIDATSFPWSLREGD